MAFLSAFAVSNHIGRIDLTTDGTNTGAQRLYEALGATRQEKSPTASPSTLCGAWPEICRGR